MYVNSLNSLATLVDSTTNTVFTTINGKPFAKVFWNRHEMITWMQKGIRQDLQVLVKTKDSNVWQTRKGVKFDFFMLGTVEDTKATGILDDIKELGGKVWIKSIDGEKMKLAGAYAYVAKAVANAQSYHKCKVCEGTGEATPEEMQEGGERTGQEDLPMPCSNCLGIGFMFGQHHKSKAQLQEEAMVQAISLKSRLDLAHTTLVNVDVHVDTERARKALNHFEGIINLIRRNELVKTAFMSLLTEEDYEIYSNEEISSILQAA